MDYDSLRDLMSNEISDAISKVYVAWLEQKGIVSSPKANEEFYKDETLKEEIKSALETFISDIDNIFTEPDNNLGVTKKDIKSQTLNLNLLTDQPFGSVEFWLEVTSACAVSGEHYIQFANKYDLDPGELDSMAAKLLGTGLSNEGNTMKSQNIIFEVYLCNGDSGHSHEFELVIENKKYFDVDSFSGGKSDEEWKSIFFHLFDNAKIGQTGKTGIYYREAAEILTRVAFDKLGWGDVTIQFYGIKVNGKAVELTEGDHDIFHDCLGIQLERHDRSMYFYG